MELIEELSAEREIRKLLALYPQYADDQRAEEWAKLFAEDGVVQAGNQRAVGHRELAAWLISVQSGPKLRHLMLNAVIEFDSPSEARCSMDMLLLRADGQAWVIAAAPRYADRIVKTAEGWRFAERVLDMRMPA